MFATHMYGMVGMVMFSPTFTSTLLYNTN